jgi:hypothetical protein
MGDGQLAMGKTAKDLWPEVSHCSFLIFHAHPVFFSHLSVPIAYSPLPIAAYLLQ